MKVKIKRYLNSQEWIEEYDVEVKDDESVLDLLDKIKYNDRSLTYRSFCRSAICGTCGVRVNSKDVLACKTKIKDVVEDGKILIEPLNRLKVIRDLVVDNSIIQESLKKAKAYFEGKKDIQYPNELKKIEKQTDCILCMACYSVCEAFDYTSDFQPPFIFSKIFRFAFDSRDERGLQRVEDAVELGLFNCVNCQKCAYVCPKGLNSAFDIKMLQNNINDHSVFGDSFDFNPTFF